MFESVFGAEMPFLLRFFIAILIVLGLIGVIAWIVRRFGVGRMEGPTSRGRQPRLAVIDAASVDGRRRLILIRRDNVEHLLMIGGPTDVVIEPNIVRAVAAARETPARAPAATDTLARAVPLGDAGTWPLQPEPASRLEPAARLEPAPAPRPLRTSVPEEPTQWSVEPEFPPPPPRRPARTADPLAGLAAELARSSEPPRLSMPADLGGPGAFMPREPAVPREPTRQRETAREREQAREREPVREREAQIERETIREREPVREREPTREREVVREREPVRMREPELARAREPEPTRVREPEPTRAREPEPARAREPEPTRAREPEPTRAREPEPPPPVLDTDFNAGADQNLADMAQRLEAALRRPAKPNEVRPAEPQPRASNPDAGAAPAAPAAPARAAAPPPRVAAAPAAEPKPQKSLYDSLEKEMANLLGRPSGKS